MKLQLIIGCLAIAVVSFAAGFRFSIWTLKKVVEDDSAKRRMTRRLKYIAEDDEHLYRNWKD